MATKKQPTDSENQGDAANETDSPMVTLVPMRTIGAVPVPESRFGERLKYAREQLGLSIEALSRLSKYEDVADQGVSASSIARYEIGDRLPGLGEFRCLCDSLQVPPQWLIYGDIGNSGKDDVEQEVLAGLAKWIRVVSSEAHPSTIEDEMQENYKKRKRMEDIAKAKKPKG